MIFEFGDFLPSSSLLLLSLFLPGALFLPFQGRNRVINDRNRGESGAEAGDVARAGVIRIRKSRADSQNLRTCPICGEGHRDGRCVGTLGEHGRVTNDRAQESDPTGRGAEVRKTEGTARKSGRPTDTTG
jgi:hypothetical protein